MTQVALRLAAFIALGTQMDVGVDLENSEWQKKSIFIPTKMMMTYDAPFQTHPAPKPWIH